ncbi:uncharacterized protein LOC113751807 isoform X1 [Coffea eugenioides]|uniref:uncharacterized protein LOC113751807 isoform X1 n=1 Tax=Coffea eugenioides TaxID=49369 RepID=UPI000F609E7A|nr:uncharacterized protein LOC113751807 isoform X1 [Coffea eugenioides]
MSDTKSEDENGTELRDDHPDDEQHVEHSKFSEPEKQDPLPCPEQQEEAIKKKYGGLAPKKRPLISKDHDHAFFDSADWALGKQGVQKSKGPLEALRPKLQPTPQQQIRSKRSAYAHSSDDSEGTRLSRPLYPQSTTMQRASAILSLSAGNESCQDKCTPEQEDQSKGLDGFSDDNSHPDDQCHTVHCPGSLHVDDN